MTNQQNEIKLQTLGNCSCGGTLKPVSRNVYECQYCGNTYTVEIPNDSNYGSLLEEASVKRNNGHFDEARECYKAVLNKSNNQWETAQANWGIFLCDYYIMHINDHVKNEYLPTICAKGDVDKIRENTYYKNAISLAGDKDKKNFEEQVKYIEDILNYANTKKYKIFICFKKNIKISDGKEGLTLDYEKARQIYEKLNEIYKDEVFFSEESLTIGGSGGYEAEIYAAITTSRVMLVVGSESDYLTSPFVKNEWTRFLRQRVYDKEKIWIPISLKPDFSHFPVALMEKDTQGLRVDDIYFLDKLKARLQDIFLSISTEIKRKEIAFKDSTKETTINGVNVRKLDNSTQRRDTTDESLLGGLKSFFEQIIKENFKGAKVTFNEVFTKNKTFDENIRDFCSKVVEKAPEIIRKEFNLDIDKGFFDLFNNAVEISSENCRKILFEYLENFTKKALSANNINWALALYKTRMSWDYNLGRDKFNNDISGIVNRWLNSLDEYKANNYVTMMREIVRYSADGSVGTYIKSLDDCAGNIIFAVKKSSSKGLRSVVYKKAQGFYDDIISHDEGNYKIRWKKILLQTGLTSEEDLKNHIRDFRFTKDFDELLERLDEKGKFDYVKRLIESVQDGFSEYVESNDAVREQDIKAFLKVYDDSINYVLESKYTYLIKSLYFMADKCKEYRYFEEAKGYYDKITNIDEKQYKAYWGKLQCLVGCVNDDELVEQKKDIVRFPEYSNARNAAKDNKTQYDYYGGLSEKWREKKADNEKTIKDTARNKGWQRHSAYSVFCMILAICGFVFAVAMTVLIVVKITGNLEFLINFKNPLILSIVLFSTIVCILAGISKKCGQHANAGKFILNFFATIFVLVTAVASLASFRSYKGFTFILDVDGQKQEVRVNPYSKKIDYIPTMEDKFFSGWQDSEGNKIFGLSEYVAENLVWTDGITLYPIWSDIVKVSFTNNEQLDNALKENMALKVDLSGQWQTITMEIPSNLQYIELSGNDNTLEDLRIEINERSTPLNIKFVSLTVASTSDIIHCKHDCTLNIDIDGAHLGSTTMSIVTNGDVNMQVANVGEEETTYVAGIRCKNLTINSLGAVLLYSKFEEIVKASTINCKGYGIAFEMASEFSAGVRCTNFVADLEFLGMGWNTSLFMEGGDTLIAEKVDITISKEAIIYGGNAHSLTGEDGRNAIIADEVTFAGKGTINIYGGIGGSAMPTTGSTNGNNGGDGGNAIVAETVVVDGVKVCAYAGYGGNGGYGAKGADNGATPSPKSQHNEGGKTGYTGSGGYEGGQGYKGGNGGASGRAIANAKTVTIKNTGNLIVYEGAGGDGGQGGTGGKGGTGGTGGAGTDAALFRNGSNGGNGGKGGKGGKGGTGGDGGKTLNAVSSSTRISADDRSTYRVEVCENKGAGGKGGNGGTGGDGGNGGRAGEGVFETYHAGSKGAQGDTGDTGAKGEGGLHE